jgi:hypothetical protein
MCICSTLPAAMAEIAYWEPRFDHRGAARFGCHFEMPDTDRFAPGLDFETRLYACGACGQAWYVEVLPEQTPAPGFALKLQDAARAPSAAHIKAEKEYLAVLAHAGFDSAPCQQAGCPNHCLHGRALCHVHLAWG